MMSQLDCTQEAEMSDKTSSEEFSSAELEDSDLDDTFDEMEPREELSDSQCLLEELANEEAIS